MNKSLSSTNASRAAQILIVEDERIIAISLKESLKALGYQVVAIAISGEEAIEQATELRPDLVLMDIWLKGDMDGIATAQHIWENLLVPVIYVTGHSDESTLQRAKRTAPFGYILKPVNERELYVAIETALQRCEREQLLNAILKGMGDAVIIVNQNGRIQFLNQAAECLTGWQIEDARDCDLTSVFKIVDEQTHTLADNPITAVLEHEQIVYVDSSILLIAKDGTTWPIGYSAAPIKNNKGAIASIVLVFRDLTSSVQLKKINKVLESTVEDLKLAQSQLVQSEKMSSIGKMAAAIVNEMTNPVSLIFGNLPLNSKYFQDLLSLIELYKLTYPNPTPKLEQLTEEIDLDFLKEDCKKLIDAMQGAAERLQEIVFSLLSLRSFSKLDEFDLKTIDIHDYIDSILRIFNYRLRGEENHPEIRVIRDYGQLPRVTCYASQLNQVFIHIISNAVDILESQSPPRIITIRTEVKQEIPNDADSQKVIVQISDNGCGMSEEVQRKIFDPFFTTKPLGSARGLGLSICYQVVVERHGGQIQCHSIVGQGTTFTIELPVIQ
ncbi:MAG TPA: ATP-binding protein [Cyanophyceae cyanobacterium]